MEGEPTTLWALAENLRNAARAVESGGVDVHDRLYGSVPRDLDSNVNKMQSESVQYILEDTLRILQRADKQINEVSMRIQPAVGPSAARAAR